MINIDTRILPQVTPDQLYLLCHIVNFMNDNKMCFPSNKKLIEQSGFSESKILRLKNDLVTRNIISVKKRLYRIETDLIGVFVTGKNMSNLEPHPFTDEDGGIFTHEGGTPLSMKGHEVLTNLSINHKEVLSSKNSIEFCQNEKDIYFEDLEEFPIFPSVEIKSVSVKKNEKQKLNPFQVVSDVEKERKENFASKEKKEVPERKPNPNYEAFTIFCQTFEQLSGANYPTDQNGNYIMMPKDAGNMVYLMRFIDKIDRNGNSHEALKIFMQAAWSLNDKWLKANFTIANLYSQASKIFTAYQTSSPAAKDKAFNDKLAELLAERMAKFED
jgi:hypothetical protein